MASAAELFKRGIASFQQGQLAEAERSFRQLLRKEPRHPAALNLLAVVLVAQKKFAEAEPLLQSALKLSATSDATFYNYGLVLKALGRPDEAVQRFTQAIALNPGSADSWNARGAALNDLNDPQAAIADFDRAASLNPNDPATFFNRSRSLTRLKRYDDALVACDRTLAMKPGMAEAWFSRGFILQKLRRPAEAAGAYARALEIDPQMPLVKGDLLHQKMLTCDWAGTDRLISDIDRDLAAGRLSVEPFAWQGIAMSERSLQRCAEIYSANRFPARFDKSDLPALRTAGKIRIGYLSGEFRQQATSLLLVGVLEQHDRQQFEVVAIDNGFDDGSATRRRIDAAVDGSIDIAALSDPQAVAAIRAAGIDILVNLNGYFGDARTRVFARRAAPIQVNYLGFPGTLGARYMDYIIADRHVLPAEHRQFYSEKVAWLPDCYQANDRQRPIAEWTFSRAECGLPAEGFVFCCFNNNYKITPATFDGWMRILKQVPGSVLWLLEDNAAAAANLRREAVARGVEAGRLVFAERMPADEHLARHRCAGLFLDTLPYNAHTTASDALWAGLPLLTCRGETFAGRVAASLLHNIGLPELVATSQSDYERLAIELATQPARLAAIAGTLRDNRLAAPLFDTARVTEHIETAYLAMVERSRAGLPPDHIAVAARPRASR
ncbi:tetratricopeptide repeat protein [Rhodopseudomonas sp. P2A-2r]|uniref:O-linked N-acetylglucosamine transferase, SPINDLY family protein n=1 Tax=Rhodopseudomonas sp. P2A-2r TaxID=2991972 RepID=UPI0022348429|nr:tetratricopeptide repeat protein [Rhodopseudomonas sp. P2A-2r]UZE48918.1 tetratricopeptide repeat protein [Rhodopseudomonas sp. P2A-2r]